MAPASTADNTLHRQDKPRCWLRLGAMGLLSGIAISALGLPSVGGWLATASALALVVGIHTFGRLGSDSANPPTQAASRVAKKHRTKRKKNTSRGPKRSLQPDKSNETPTDSSEDASKDSSENAPENMVSNEVVTRTLTNDLATEDENHSG